MVPQQIKDDLEAALVTYGAFLTSKVTQAEIFKEGAEDAFVGASDKLTSVTGLYNQTVIKASEAVASALLSYQWANAPEDTAVSGGEFSAYHHRRKAEVAAQQVLTALTGSVVFKGNWNASGNTFPSDVSPGWMYRLNAGGTLTFEDIGAKLTAIGDYILKTDTGWTYIDEATDAVKSSRTINGKPLNVDIVLTPGDVQAVAIADLATQAIAEAGTDDAKWMSSLKTRQALQKMGIGLTASPNAIANIDAFDIPTGMYRTASGTAGTFPNANVADFTLIVTRVSATSVNQILIYVDGHMWVRGSSSSVWGAWRGATPSQYGIGGPMNGTPTLDLNDLRTGGIWITDNVAAVNIPTGWPQARYSVIVGGSETYATQIITNQSATSGVDVARMAVRRMRNLGTWSEWFEIWNSNTLKKQTTLTDTTAGAILSPGSFGVGNAGTQGINLSNLDATDLPTGFFNCVTATTGTKPGGLMTDMAVYVHKYDVDQISQLIVHTLTGRTFVRTYAVTAWTAWTELWSSGNLRKQTSAIDATVGSMLVVGAGGLLGHGAVWGSNDANLFTVSGFFKCSTGMLNVPNDVLVGSLLMNYVYDAGNRYQEIFHRDADVRYWRRRRDGIWGGWFKMFHSGSPVSDHPELSARLDTLSLQAAMAL